MNNPFDLNDTASYLHWREHKHTDGPLRLKRRLVVLERLANLVDEMIAFAEPNNRFAHRGFERLRTRPWFRGHEKLGRRIAPELVA